MHAVGRQPRKHRLRQMLANLVEAQAAGLTLGVASAGAQRAEVIVAIHLRGEIEIDDAARRRRR